MESSATFGAPNGFLVPKVKLGQKKDSFTSDFDILLFLPIDMEWLKSDDGHNMEVDIGYMGQMELRSTGPSRPATYEGY